MGFDRTMTLVKLSIDDFEESLKTNNINLSQLIKSVTIKETDEAMSQVDIVFLNVGSTLTDLFLQIKRSIIRVWFGYPAQEGEQETYEYFGTFRINEPVFIFPNNGIPTINLKGFSEEIDMAESERQVPYENKADHEIVKEIASRYQIPFGVKYVQQSYLDLEQNNGLPDVPLFTNNEIQVSVEDEEATNIDVPLLRTDNVDRGQTTQIESDYTFLTKLAKRNGFHFFIVPNPNKYGLKTSADYLRTRQYFRAGAQKRIRGDIFFGNLTEESIASLNLSTGLQLEYFPENADDSTIKSAKFSVNMFRAGLNVEIERVNPVTELNYQSHPDPIAHRSNTGPYGYWVFGDEADSTDQLPTEQSEIETYMRRMDPNSQFVLLEDIGQRIRVEEGDIPGSPQIWIRQYDPLSLFERNLEQYRQAIHRQGLWAIKGKINPVVGILCLRVRCFLTIKGVDSFSGPYYIKKATHKWANGKLEQTFDVCTFMLGKNSEPVQQLPVASENS